MPKRFYLRIASIVLLGSVFVGQGCTKAPDAATQAASKHVELNVWGVVDDADVYGTIFKDYRVLHPNVAINYRRFRLEEYEDALLNGFAEDRGPDIFLIHNTWVGKYLPKITPMPPSTTVAVQRIVGTLKKEAVYQLETTPSISLRAYKNNYPEAVSKDTIRQVNVSTKPDERKFEDRILAVPLSVDTLAMYVNKDLLNAAGIATIPSGWGSFQSAIPRLVKTDKDGKLLQAAAALGTGYNVERASDILSVLMMQNRTQMVDPNGAPTFDQLPENLSGELQEPPAYQALRFYTDFANPAKESYTWNAEQPNSLDAFVQGRLAFFFGYSYHLPLIRARAPKLNLGIAKLPQIENSAEANFANYWVWTVAKKAKNPDVAWNFLNFAMSPKEAKTYLEAAKRPAAEKSLLQDQLEDEDIGVFAEQVLTARSWYEGRDPKAMEDAFSLMAEHVVAGTEEIPTALRNAIAKIRQTME